MAHMGSMLGLDGWHFGVILGWYIGVIWGFTLGVILGEWKTKWKRLFRVWSFTYFMYLQSWGGGFLYPQY